MQQVFALILMVLTLVCTPALAFETNAKQAVVLDATTGAVLFDKNAKERMTPSSMSKLMTLYVVFDRLKQEGMSLQDKLYVSERAWKKGGSKTFVHVGEYVILEDMIHGIATQSGNDACIVVAEALAGTEEDFAREMNRVAERIGLTGSHFMNSTGWPDPEHYMTAYDVALLSLRHVKDFPEYYPYFAEPEFTYAGIRQYNRNTLLSKNIGIDGLKTGHTEDGGYGIAISGEQNGRRVVVVVNGLSSEKERAQEAERLYHYGLNSFDNYKIFAAGDVVERAGVWMGDNAVVPLVTEHDIVLTLPRGAKDKVAMSVHYQEPLPAPIVKGTELGSVTITVPDMPDRVVPLVAAQDVGELSGMRRIWPAMKYYLTGR